MKPTEFDLRVSEWANEVVKKSPNGVSWVELAYTLTKERDELVRALEFYANKANWYSTHGKGDGTDDTIKNDCEGWVAGKTAREALTKIDKSGGGT